MVSAFIGSRAAIYRYLHVPNTISTLELEVKLGLYDVDINHRQSLLTHFVFDR